ncbi:uncharacterized protein K452DRAFT_285885 [Aplosporella prunicola CBS 121167]|uniref:Uncharacterized protein n=1 Tax=Aplosporella prunicola CBS 121167 TaxID=1176127 RepID=A0A6A6BJP3_9PEZI|nr:uncharacterized protein K452DRAFT_285885 [Aplosporella prunicola CBS 121167]KAF2143848.1 hypothetical protein K452DRAFT_285885 [Aplosporella prunicola CBS 121167]
MHPMPNVHCLRQAQPSRIPTATSMHPPNPGRATAFFRFLSQVKSRSGRRRKQTNSGSTTTRYRPP